MVRCRFARTQPPRIRVASTRMGAENLSVYCPISFLLPLPEATAQAKAHRVTLPLSVATTFMNQQT